MEDKLHPDAVICDPIGFDGIISLDLGLTNKIRPYYDISTDTSFDIKTVHVYRLIYDTTMELSPDVYLIIPKGTILERAVKV